jgi:alpha-galactosidase
MYSLSNQYLDFFFDPGASGWTLQPKLGKPAGLTLGPVRLGAHLITAVRNACHWNGDTRDVEAVARSQAESPHGTLQLLTLSLAPRAVAGLPCALRFTLEFALPEAQPFLLWRATAHHEGGPPGTLESLDLAVTHFVLSASHAGLRFFSNGYQSWSFAGSLRAGLRPPSSGLGPFAESAHLNLANPRPHDRGHFVSDLFGVVGDVDEGVGVVAGFMAQREQFGHLEMRLDQPSLSLCLTAQCDGVTLAAGEARRTDWAYLQFISLDAPDPLQDYIMAVARENQARVPDHTPVGWCSWYHYFDKITENDVMSNLHAIAGGRDRLPLDFVQLDDGFQSQVGDWFGTKPTFPHSLRWLADEIRSRGHTPGVWLAPYIVRSDAQVWRDHPDWLLRGRGGRPANAGYLWFKWCYGLDPTHPEVREQTRRLMTTAVREWGFPYLKLDFLYAAALPGRRYDPRLTRAQAMRLALTDIREAAGQETFILGCGLPLGSAVGFVDGMRISADVAPDWLPVLFSPLFSPLLRQEWEMASARNAIQNIISRAPLHRRWWLNDPDCLLARDDDTRLTEAEVCSLATVIALSGGMFLVSDDLGRLSAARRRFIVPLLPVLNESARAPGWMRETTPQALTLPLSGPTGDWLVAGVFNWADRLAGVTQTLAGLGLDAQAEYWVSDFWEGKHWRQSGATPLQFVRVPPHGGHLLALRRLGRGPSLVASSFHFSQGKEITRWRETEGSLEFSAELGRVAEGEVRLALPAAPREVTVDGQNVTARDLGEGVYSLAFAVNRTAAVRVAWDGESAH